MYIYIYAWLFIYIYVYVDIYKYIYDYIYMYMYIYIYHDVPFSPIIAGEIPIHRLSKNLIHRRALAPKT